MATIFAFPYGPGQTQDNLTGLPAGFAVPLGVVGDGNPIMDINILPMLFLAGAGATGTIELYVACSEDNNHWSGNITPTATQSTNQAASLTNNAVRQIWRLNVTGAGLYRSDAIGLYAALGGFVPIYHCLLVLNNTQAAFGAGATNYFAGYSRLNYSAPVPVSYA
jgi:hypothetical protein